MTLNAKIGVLWIFWRFWAVQIAPKSIEIDMDKLRVKFSALNVDFDGSHFNFLGLRKLAR